MTRVALMIERPTRDALTRAAARLVAGGLVAMPTETVYGLAARADDSNAVRAIYALKGRPSENPSIVHCRDAASAFLLAEDIPAEAEVLAQAFWPGPLTIVLAVRAGAVAPEVTAFGPTVALRVPAHPVTCALLAAAAVPLAAPSANRSTRVSPTSAEHVARAFGSELMILDGGDAEVGIESSIVDLSRRPFALLRSGKISLSELARFAAFEDHTDGVVPAGTRAKSPGSALRHYAPGVPVLLAPREELRQRLSALALPERYRVGLLVWGEPWSDDASGPSLSQLLPADAAGYAHGLYRALQDLEAKGANQIFIEQVPDDPTFAAIADRLTRAAR